MRLFVYGTLMRGLENHGVLNDLGAEFIANGSVAGRLYLCAYPALVRADGGGRVRGELYALPHSALALRSLDDFEEEGRLYRRVVESVMVDGGGDVPAYAYRYLLPVSRCTRIEGGDFRAVAPLS